MAYSVIFKFPDTTTFDASTIITQNIEISESLCNNKFESSKNTAKFETVFDNTLLTKIEAADGFITVEIKDGSTWIFNGVLQPLNDLSVTNQRDTFNFDLFDKGALLEYNLTSPQFYNGETVQDIVDDLLTGSGVTVSSWPTRAGSSTVVRGVFNTESQVWNLIDGVLKEFGFCFYFLPDGTMEVVDLMLEVASSVTIDDSSNHDTINGSVKYKKASERGRGEKISVQADYYDAYKIAGHSIFSSVMASDSDSIAFKSIASMNSEYFDTCAKNISGSYTEMVFLDNQVFNISSPKSSARYLGAENISGVIYFRAAYDAYLSTGTWNRAWMRVFKLTITNGALTSAEKLLIDGNGGGWSTLTGSHYVFSITTFSDKFVISFKITNSTYFTAGGSTSRFNRLLTHTVKMKGDVWLGTHVEPVKITNAKSKVENYSLNFAQTESQVTDFLNLKSDIANNRNWNTTWDSYTGRDIGTGATVSMTKVGVSVSGVITEKKTTITRAQKKYSYKLVSFTDISITTPSAATSNAAQPAPPPGTDSSGNLIAPVISNMIEAIDTATLAESGIILSSEAFGFYDTVEADFRALIGSDGSFRLGLISGQNLQYDPTTGDLTLTGSIIAEDGTIGGWLIGTDTLKSAASGRRVELNKTKSRVSIFDATDEVVAMGYLGGLVDPISGGTIGSTEYGFWAKNGNTINFKSNIIFEATQQVINSTFQLLDASNDVKITLGTGSGMFSAAQGIYIGDYYSPVGWLTETELGIKGSNGQLTLAAQDSNNLFLLFNTQKTLQIHSQGNDLGGSHLARLNFTVANSSGVEQDALKISNTVAGGTWIDIFANIIGNGGNINLYASNLNLTNAGDVTVANGGYDGGFKRATGYITPIGTILEFAGVTLPTGYFDCDGTSYSRSTYSRLFNALNSLIATGFTVSSNTITTSTAHGLTTGDSIFFYANGGTLGTNQVDDKLFYVQVLSTTTFKIHYSQGSAINNKDVISTTSPTGNVQIYKSPWGITSNSTFKVPDLRAVSTTHIGARTDGLVAGGTMTVTIASPAVMTFSVGPTLNLGDKVAFTTSGALPTGLSQNTIYYVTPISHTTYKLSTTLANCLAGTFINTSGSQSGTHTVTDSAFSIDNMGVLVDDEFQEHQIGADQDGTGTRDLWGQAQARDTTPSTAALSNSSTIRVTTTAQGVATKLHPKSDGTNGTPRTGKTTHGKMIGLRKIIKYD